MLELDGKTYYLGPDVMIKFAIQSADRKAGAVKLAASDVASRKPVKGNGMMFKGLKQAQYWCINAGYIKEYITKKRGKR